MPEHEEDGQCEERSAEHPPVEKIRHPQHRDWRGEDDRTGRLERLEDSHTRSVGLGGQKLAGMGRHFGAPALGRDMFTGIVEGTGTISRVIEDDDGRRLRIDAEYTDLSYGQSISVSGVCLTVEDYDEGWFEVFTATETLSKTYLGSLKVGDPVNLERALAADERFDGHVVQGHVDTTTTVESIERIDEDWSVTVALPTDHEQYVVPRGSIALDGVSLTVADVDEANQTFEVAIVPTTYELTTFRGIEPGDSVHVEVDIFAKYVERMLAEE